MPGSTPLKPRRPLRLGVVLLGMAGCAAVTEPAVPALGDASGVEVGSEVVVGSCSAADCVALAGPCREGRCDALTGACRLGAAHEGMACLEGNPCGPAQCRSGECVPLAPPSCSEWDDACQSGVCTPQDGCVARPRRLPGASEEDAVRLSPSGIGSAAASTACSEAGAALSTLALAGPSAYFELDLTAATRATRVISIIDGAFAFEAALTRGPSADPAVLQRAAPFYQDGQSRRIDAELEPGLYHLVVTGKSATDRGPLHVASAVGERTCQPPDNDACATPRVLEGSLAQQTVLVDMACATPSVPVRCADLEAPDVFYELDLSERSREVLLDVEVVAGRFDDAQAYLLATGTQACSEVTTCAESWSWRVSPGRHELGISVSPSGVPEELAAVRVRLTEDGCSGTSNDRPDTAIDLDPALARQQIQGNTACARDDFSGSCQEERGSPDLFYRLDLRGRSAPQELRIEGQTAAGLGLYVLPAAAATAGSSSACSQLYSSSILAPRLYYLVVDGGVANAGAFNLELSLSDAYAVPRPCQPRDSDSSSCLSHSEPACASSSAHPDCLRAAVDCGLAQEVYLAFCATLPGCCDGTSPSESCQGAWEAAITCRD
jgi:hypothetical protein